MNVPSDLRFALMCLVAAVVGFGAWIAFLEPRSAVWAVVVAIPVLALLMAVDGYVSSALERTR